MSDNLKIPPILDCVVELGMVRMRMAVGPSARQSYRPRLCLWVDQRTGMIAHFEMTEPLESYLPLVVNSMGGLADRIGGLPRQVQLRDTQLAMQLRPILERAGVEVVVRESLPMLDEAVSSMQEFKRLGGDPEPGLLDVPGMTLDHLIAFAEAARAFYEARPWRHLIDDDLIAIQSPAGPVGTQFTQVLGAGGQTFGLGFVASRQAHEDLRAGHGLPRGGMWSLLFADIDDIPYDDGEAWERHGLAVAGRRGYPCFARLSKSKDPVYPTPHPQQLVWAEGLLRALAGTTEEELDQGRWEKRVETLTGAMTYQLTMPLLLEQMSGKTGADPAMALHAGRIGMEPVLRAIGQQLASRGPMSEDQLHQFMASVQDKPQTFTPTTDAERAQAMCYQAYESRGRRQVQLARQALVMDPDCCDALLMLAERAVDPQSAMPLYERAVQAGQRQLGSDRFEKDAGHFWGIVETRPYMRAQQQLALTLMELADFDQAAGHFNELLRLNPNDNQGNRYHYAQCLLSANRLDHLDVLLNRSEYKDDFAAEWAFTRALLEFRRNGDSPDLRRRLDEAQKRNRFVVPLLTGRAPVPAVPPSSFSPGSEDEALVCMEQIAEGWHETPGAIEWLESTAARVQRRARQWQRARDRKRKRR
jgi:tetratricopeptide (TPR) repeat protein